MKTSLVRNVLVVLGAYYISGYLALPLWLPVVLAWSDSIADGGLGPVGIHLILAVMLGLCAGVAGVLLGWVLEMDASRWWGGALALLVVIACLQRNNWRVANKDDLIGLCAQALISGAMAFFGFSVGRDWQAGRQVRRRQAGAAS